MALKKAIISVMLSALLIGSTAIPIYAVEDKESSVDTVADEVELEEEDEEEDEYDPWGSEESELSEESEDSEQSEESENTEVSKEESVIQESEQSQEQSKEESKQESKEESKVQEQSKDESKEESKIQEQSKDESKEESKIQERSKEESKTEESSTEIKTGRQKIKISVNLNNARISNTCTDMRIDFSNVSMKLMTTDRKTVLKAFNMQEILSAWKTVPVFDLEVEVPKWGSEEDNYLLVFDNLPEIYTSTYQEFNIKCTFEELPDGKVRVSGVDFANPVKLSVKDFNVMVFVYDITGNTVKNVAMEYSLCDSEGRAILFGDTKTTNAGCAIFKLPYDELKEFEEYSLVVIIPNSYNGSVASGRAKFDYVRTVSDISVYSIEADAKEEEVLKGEDGNISVGTVAVPLKVTYGDAFDMELFSHRDFQLQTYNGENIGDIIEISRDNVEGYNIFSAEGNTLTLRGDSKDYKLNINPMTLKVSKDSSVSINAVPQLSLTIINESNGVKNNAHFTITGTNKEYNEVEHKFAVNYGTSYTVKNLDTDEEYSVYISNYKDTILNIANGDISKDGYVGNDNLPNSTNTSSGSNISPTDIQSVPKTGDIVFSIIMILIGMSGLSYLGYLYFKRKGIKHNEDKK